MRKYFYIFTAEYIVDEGIVLKGTLVGETFALGLENIFSEVIDTWIKKMTNSSDFCGAKIDPNRVITIYFGFWTVE